jgi:hypothetical protein
MLMENNLPGSVCFLGLQEILGPDETKKYFDAASTSSDWRNTLPAWKKMEAQYGATAVRGIAVCAGRSAFKYLLTQDGEEIGFDSDDFRFLPLRRKLKKGLTLLSAWFTRTFDTRIELEPAKQNWLLKVSEPSAKEGTRLGDEDNCSFFIGLVQGFMTWVGGGKYYRVIETQCRHQNSSYCCFQIDKTPLE